MSKPDTSAFEKAYLTRSGAGDWERFKPFPPPGQSGTEEHARLLLDFAVLLRTLAPAPGELVLDLGAGSCWCSEWLRRFGHRTVSVDIALDMLRLGRARVGDPPGLVAGDMQALPFADGTFPKACCLNAFHHVPDPDRALAEIARVLSPEGVVFFAEPGLGHADHPTSIAATRDFGVLEEEVRADQFMEACLRAGFADVRLHPISHVIPLFELRPRDWAAWCSFTRSQRPFRALDKLWRAVREIVGLGKQGALFEEAFAIRLLREMQPVIEQHPVVTAHKSKVVRVEDIREQAVIRLHSAVATAEPGASLTLRLAVRNTGTTSWESAGRTGHVRVGVQLLRADGSVIDRDYVRQGLPGPVAPGGGFEMLVQVPAPREPGAYVLRVDLVREGVAWFEMVGSRPLDHRLDVGGGR